MLLAGDIGGTKTVLALFDESGPALDKVREEVYPSQGYPTFDAILDLFLAERPAAPIRTGCLGVAGTIVDGRSRTTNLPWELSEGELAGRLGAKRVKLLNDLEAAAFGMLFLGPDETCVIQPGSRERRPANIGVIAAGTGLGEAMLYWDGEQYLPIASEGGHSDFAPQSDLEIGLLRYLSEKYGGHVSWERVLSGPAFHNIYSYLRDTEYAAEDPTVAAQLRAGDPNQAISRLGLIGHDPLCTKTMEIFCSVYGAESGNLALRSVATGGIYIGGGIAPKILTALRRPDFARAFAAKGRYHDYLAALEVRVALNPRAPLIGAAHYAARL